MRKIFLLSLIGVALTATARIPLKITEKRVSGDKCIVVGLTDKDANVSVGKYETKVYKSGCFGAEVPLKEGENKILVVASKGNELKTETVEYTYTPKKGQASTSKSGSTSDVPEVKAIEPMTVRTKKGAYMQYGNGGDRLGGSKMGYLDEGITLKAVGVSDKLYKVRMSGTRYAFVPKEYVEKTSSKTEVVNTGSWGVKNVGGYDQVSVSLPTRLPYSSFTDIDPNTICVDIYSAQCNSNWITQLDGLEIIDYVDFRQIESDVLRAIIRLKGSNWGYSIHYSGNSLVVKVKHTPNLKLSAMTIGLDAGHGGKYPGAVGNSGLTEKEINLKLILMVKERLEKRGAKVVLTRKDDSEVTMSERNRILREANVDLAISIHNNSGGSPLVEMGSSTYYKHTFCRPLAAVMRKHLLGLGFKDYGLTGNFNFALSQPTDYPSALLEVLFMSSLPDEEKLLDKKWQNKIADSVVAGIEDFIKQMKSAKTNKNE